MHKRTGSTQKSETAENSLRKDAEGYAKITAKLKAMLRKGMEYRWSETCNQGLVKLKEEITKRVILSHPKFNDDNAEFILLVDASNSTLGAASYQKHDGEEVLLGFASWELSKSERNYGCYKRAIFDSRRFSESDNSNIT